jgi:hypothetical protein
VHVCARMLGARATLLAISRERTVGIWDMNSVRNRGRVSFPHHILEALEVEFVFTDAI